MRLVYFLIIKPLSLLPFKVQYFISDLIYLLLYYVVGYRKSVVFYNLRMVFPHYEEKEISQIAKRFYRHFTDIIIEAVKGFSLSRADLGERYRVVGIESTFNDFDEGRDIIIAAGHYGNWEWGAMAVAQDFKHECIGIYTKIKNNLLEDKLSSSRSKTGLVLVEQNKFRQLFNDSSAKTPRAYMFLFDQSPSNPERAYWLRFLGVPTACQFGVESYARKRNLPVYYANINRTSRGYYKYDLISVSKNPSLLKKYELIQILYKHLEATIKKEPSRWLWTHRRWKHKKKDQEKS